MRKFLEPYLSWNRRTSTPHRSETNGIAERAVRRVKEGTSAVLLQPGLDEKWWSDSVECYCYLRNVQDLLADGKTPHERRFGESFKGPIIPFGALVEYLPSSARDQARIHQIGNRVLPGIFRGYALIAERIWKGDILTVDVEELEILNASDILSQKTECERSLDNSEERKICICRGRWEHTERSVRGEFLCESEESQPAENEMTLKSVPTSGLFRVISSSVITKKLEFNSVGRRRNILHSTEIH